MGTQVGASFSYNFKEGDRPKANDFNLRWSDIDRRLVSVEKPQETLDAFFTSLQTDAVARFQTDVLPVYKGILETVQLGVIFAATATATVKVGIGLKSFLVSDADKSRFAAAQWISATHQNSTNTYHLSMVGERVSFDRETGILVLNVITAHGLGETASSWQLSVSPPPFVPVGINGGVYDNAPPYKSTVYVVGFEPDEDLNGGLF